MTVAVLVRYIRGGTSKSPPAPAAGKLGESNARATTGRGQDLSRAAATAKRCWSPTKRARFRRSTNTKSWPRTWRRSAGPIRSPTSSPARRSPSASKIAVPNEVAEKLLGLGGEMGERHALRAHAAKTSRQIDGATCAEFRADHRSRVDRFVADAAGRSTGRWRSKSTPAAPSTANFAGPIGMSETRGSLTATYQMTGTGKMTVSIASKYSDSQR